MTEENEKINTEQDQPEVEQQHEDVPFPVNEKPEAKDAPKDEVPKEKPKRTPRKRATSIKVSGEATPLDAPVISRPHTKANYEIPKEGIPRDIPEAKIPKLDININNTGLSNPVEETYDPTKAKEQINKLMSGEEDDDAPIEKPAMSNKALKAGAKRLAETFLGWYCLIIEQGMPMIAKFSDKRIQKMLKDVGLPSNILYIEMPLNLDGSRCSLMDKFNKHNSDVDEVCKVEEEEREKLLDLLTDFCIEMGWSISTQTSALLYILEKTFTRCVAVITSRTIVVGTFNQVAKRHLEESPITVQKPAQQQQRQEQQEQPQEAEPQTEKVHYIPTDIAE